MPEHLFVYGTLRPGHAPDEIAEVVGSLKPIGKATLRGTRYNLGAFPAVPHVRLKEERPQAKVHGELFALPDDSETLARLDEYEEYDPKHPNQSLFRRTRVNVTLADGRRESCWVYLYNRPIPKVAVLMKQAGRSRLAAKVSR